MFILLGVVVQSLNPCTWEAEVHSPLRVWGQLLYVYMYFFMYESAHMPEVISIDFLRSLTTWFLNLFLGPGAHPFGKTDRSEAQWTTASPVLDYKCKQPFSSCYVNTGDWSKAFLCSKHFTEQAISQVPWHAHFKKIRAPGRNTPVILQWGGS